MRARADVERLGAAAGVLFVAGVVFALLGPAGREPGDTSAEVVRFAVATERWIRVSQLVALLAVILVPIFAVALFSVLRRVDAQTEAVLTLVAATVFGVLYCLTFTIWEAPLLSIAGNDHAAPGVRLADAQTYLGASDTGWVLFGAVGFAASLMIAAATTGARSGDLVPGWAVVLGYALAAGSLATVAVVGVWAWLLWLLLASVALSRGGRGGSRPKV